MIGRIAFLLLTIAISGNTGCAMAADTASQEGSDMTKPTVSIHSSVARILAADGSDRAMLAAELQQHVAGLGAAQRAAITQEEVDNIAQLLSDDSLTVQYYAAIALGDIGPQASHAVPALREAINRIEAEEQQELIKPTVSGTYQLYIAIQKIIGEPPPDRILKGH